MQRLKGEKMSSTQLLLEFPQEADFSAESFMPFQSNQQAMLAVSTLKIGAGNVLVLQGSAGSGKSHLLKVWCAMHGAPYLSPQNLEDMAVPQLQAAAIDNVDELTPSAQVHLFHLFNYMKCEDGALLLATKIPVAQLSMLPDLKSRLLTAQHVEIQNPNELELKQLLVKWAHDCQLTLSTEVIAYILKRADRSSVKLQKMVQTLNTRSLTEKRAVTVPLVRKLLSD